MSKKQLDVKDGLLYLVGADHIVYCKPFCTPFQQAMKDRAQAIKVNLKTLPENYWWQISKTHENYLISAWFKYLPDVVKQAEERPPHDVRANPIRKDMPAEVESELLQLLKQQEAPAAPVASINRDRHIKVLQTVVTAWFE